MAFVWPPMYLVVLPMADCFSCSAAFTFFFVPAKCFCELLLPSVAEAASLFASLR